MAYHISPFHSYSMILEDGGSAVPRLLIRLTRSGTRLLGFTESAVKSGTSRIELLTSGTPAPALGHDLRETGTGLLISGEDWPNPFADALVLLSNADIGIAAAEAISSPTGTFEALIWIKPGQLERAAAVLRSSLEAPLDPVEESSLESFPASDPPAWAMR